MSQEDDDYEVWLETWEPGPRAAYASLPHNHSDPLARMRMLEDSSGEAALERTAFSPGYKTMEAEEQDMRFLDFIGDHHEEWAAGFEDYLLSRDIPQEKIRAFVTSFADDWVDGASRRQNSPNMMAIKASIRDLDHLRNPREAKKWVIYPIDDEVTALFTPDEMAAIFDANAGLIAAYLPEYADKLSDLGTSVPSDLYVRRGAYMPGVTAFRQELHYLSSYSLALGPTEQFAQTWTPKLRGKGVPSLFSAPLPAVQTRIVAFAPFIKAMGLSQLELVVAPPVERTPLVDHGEHGGIREFSFA